MRLNRRKYLQITKGTPYKFSSYIEAEVKFIIWMAWYRSIHPKFKKTKAIRYMVNRIGDSERKFREVVKGET